MPVWGPHRPKALEQGLGEVYQHQSVHDALPLARLQLISAVQCSHSQRYNPLHSSQTLRDVGHAGAKVAQLQSKTPGCYTKKSALIGAIQYSKPSHTE